MKMNKMDLNPVKKMKIANSSASEYSEHVDGLNSGEKKIAKLNHDCLAQVLMYTSVGDRLMMENVCQTWRETVELSWYSVKKLEFGDLMIRIKEREEILKKIMSRCCRYLTHLAINEHYPWMTRILKENCPKIIHFDINIEETCEIPVKEFVEIIETMSQLMYLKVSTHGFEAKGSVFLNKLLEALPGDIEEIHLIQNSWIDRFYRVLLPGKLNNLHCLTLQGMSVTDEIIESMMPSKNTLTHLDLSRGEFSSAGSQIFSTFRNLEQLILGGLTDFNIDAISSIADNCLKLKHFELTNWGITNATLPYHVFCELRYLNLEHLHCGLTIVGSENIISGLGNNWKDLKHFDVGRGCNFSLLDLQEITKFKKLKYLNISHAEVDSKSFVNITSNCLELKELSIRLGRISETALKQLTKLKKLEKLNPDYSYLPLSKKLHSKIVNNCKNLVTLDLTSCKNPTKALLIQVGKLENLKKLDIWDIKNVPNEMFYNFSKLEHLSCESCPSVTDEGIIKVIHNCKKLNYLNIWGTGVTAKSLVHAANREFACSKLRIRADKSVKDAFKAKNNSTMTYSQFLQYCLTTFRLEM